MHGIQNPSEVRVDTQPRRERERLCLPTRTHPLTPEGRRRLWGVGKNAVTSRNRASVARAKGRLRGKQPKLSAKQQTELRRMHKTGDYEPMYTKGARGDFQRSALFFGQLVWYVVMLRPERWASGRYQVDGRDIGSRTYFRLGA